MSKPRGREKPAWEGPFYCETHSRVSLENNWCKECHGCTMKQMVSAEELGRENERSGALMADVETLVELIEQHGDEMARPLMNKRLSDYGQAVTQEGWAEVLARAEQAEFRLEAARQWTRSAPCPDQMLEPMRRLRALLHDPVPKGPATTVEGGTE